MDDRNISGGDYQWKQLALPLSCLVIHGSWVLEYLSPLSCLSVGPYAEMGMFDAPLLHVHHFTEISNTRTYADQPRFPLAEEARPYICRAATREKTQIQTGEEAGHGPRWGGWGMASLSVWFNQYSQTPRHLASYSYHTR